MKKQVKRVVVGAALAGASVGAFAQASGVDVTSTVASISAVATSITAIGAAVLSIVVVAWGYRVVKGFIGR